MKRSISTPHSDEPLRYAFSPIHKAALGVAFGSVLGLLLFAVTGMHVLVQPNAAPPLELLVNCFYGYEVSWRGAVIGMLWGGMTGFVIGWFMAFVGNLAVSIAVFALRTKAELHQTADFPRPHLRPVAP